MPRCGRGTRQGSLRSPSRACTHPGCSDCKARSCSKLLRAQAANMLPLILSSGGAPRLFVVKQMQDRQPWRHSPPGTHFSRMSHSARGSSALSMLTSQALSSTRMPCSRQWGSPVGKTCLCVEQGPGRQPAGQQPFTGTPSSAITPLGKSPAAPWRHVGCSLCPAGPCMSCLARAG